MVEVFRRHRHLTDIAVQVRTPSGTVKARVIDVNEMGARIVGNLAVEKGQKVVLLNRMDEMPGIVRWVGEDRLGMTFRPMLTSRQVEMLRGGGLRPRQGTKWDPTSLRELR